ncbi:STAS domain-containing protein [Solirubrobacter ginsenosidimutans]|uniref:STAS domain-containing protein n=1 Tax=Solirubrobacter ginsenosidimutans TaxID=490573 RepID=A0A9X3N514_9ACTN|nr:STAS domain-containing protein [Solirubrobacter ginsenosidimutans]MDA0167253.1 STAS domain-containing protein [Solirubrobacter ginsenosidimutans]
MNGISLGATIRLLPAGELDLATAPDLDRALRAAQQRASDVTLDLRDLGFMDCSSLVLLTAACDRARRSGGAFHIRRGAAPIIDRLFTLTGIDGLLQPPAPRPDPRSPPTS